MASGLTVSQARAAQLFTVLSAVCPIAGVAVLDPVAHLARIDFDPAATPAQISAANAALAGFDWSQAAQDAFDLAQARTGTTGLTTTPIQQQPLAALVRAVVLLALDEFNNHTANSNAILAAAAAATSLADFKTRMGLIANLPVRTKAQLLAAMTAKISAGDTDA